MGTATKTREIEDMEIRNKEERERTGYRNKQSWIQIIEV